MTSPHHGTYVSVPVGMRLVTYFSQIETQSVTLQLSISPPTLVDCLRTCACAIFLYVVSQFEKPRALDSVKQTFPPLSPPFNQHLLEKKKKKNDWAVVVQVRRKKKRKKKRETKDARSVVASISAVAVLFLFCPLFSIPGLQAKRARGHNG